MVLRKFIEITNKPIFTLYNIFYKKKYLFFQSVFLSLFNYCCVVFVGHLIQAVAMLFSIFS